MTRLGEATIAGLGGGPRVEAESSGLFEGSSRAVVAFVREKGVCVSAIGGSGPREGNAESGATGGLSVSGTRTAVDC